MGLALHWDIDGLFFAAFDGVFVPRVGVAEDAHHGVVLEDAF